MPSETGLKPAITIEQQIELLESRGLVIDQKDKANLFLKDNNYYRLNVYFHKLMDNQNHFIPETNFSKVIKIYETDCYLRKQIFSMLEPIEIKLKTKIAYHIGCKYGSSAFYQKGIYKSARRCDQILQSFLKEISWEVKNPVISHHYERYSGYFPIWVIVEFLSFHNISKYYENLQTKDQKIIALEGFGINERLLISWFHSLSVMRNICAHFGYLYKREYAVPIKFGRDYAIYENKENTLFGIFYCIKHLSNINQWTYFFDDVCEIVGKETLIRDYFFPEDFLV